MEEELTALLASVAGGRRYWGKAPQAVSVEAGAYLILTRIDGSRDYTMQRASGYVESRVQMDVYAMTYTAAKKAARGAMVIASGYRGGSIQGIFIDSERDLPATDAGEVTYPFRTSVDLIIHHTE